MDPYLEQHAPDNQSSPANLNTTANRGEIAPYEVPIGGQRDKDEDEFSYERVDSSSRTLQSNAMTTHEPRNQAP